MKQHRFNPVAGSAGLCYVILAVGFFLDAIDVWDAEVAWLAPVFLIAFGAAGVLSTVTRGARSEPTSEPAPSFDAAWAEPKAEQPTETPEPPTPEPAEPTSEPEEVV